MESADRMMHLWLSTYRQWIKGVFELIDVLANGRWNVVVHFVFLAYALHVLPLGARIGVVLLDAVLQQTKPFRLGAVLVLVALERLQDLVQQRFPKMPS